MDRLSRIESRRQQLEETEGSALENKGQIERLKIIENNLKRDIANEQIEIKTLKAAKNKEKQQAKVDKLRTELPKKETERNTAEERLNSPKPLDELKEREAELKRKNE